MNWNALLTLISEACASDPDERRVLLELADARFHVKEPLATELEEGALLGFVVYADDPVRSQRTERTRLLFVPPERVLRILVDGASEQGGGGFGF